MSATGARARRSAGVAVSRGGTSEVRPSVLARAKKRRKERGATAVEFAFIVPVLIALVFGIVDFGLYINATSVVGNSAREGVRAGALGSNQSEIESVVTSAMSSLPGNPAANTTTTVTCRTPGGGACGSYNGSATSGGTAIVQIAYVHTWLTPLGFGTNITINKQSEMRIE